MLFSPDGRKLVGTRVATSLIDSFTVGRGGLPTAAPGSPFAAQGLGLFGSEFRPTNAAQLYVTNAHDGANAGTVSAFAVGADGTLTTIAASPFPDEQTAPCWVEISHDGQYLFAVNTASGSISSYSIATGGSLTLLRNTSVNAAATPEDARLSPDGTTSGSSTPQPTPSAVLPSPVADSPNCRPRPRPLRSGPHPPASLSPAIHRQGSPTIVARIVHEAAAAPWSGPLSCPVEGNVCRPEWATAQRCSWRRTAWVIGDLDPDDR